MGTQKKNHEALLKRFTSILGQQHLLGHCCSSHVRPLHCQPPQWSNTAYLHVVAGMHAAAAPLQDSALLVKIGCTGEERTHGAACMHGAAAPLHDGALLVKVGCSGVERSHLHTSPDECNRSVFDFIGA